MRLALMAGLYWFVKHERILSGASPQTRPYSWKTLYFCLKIYILAEVSLFYVIYCYSGS